MIFSNQSLFSKTFFIAIIILSNHTYMHCQNIDWSAIKTDKTTSIKGRFNGLNIGGYGYGKMNIQGTTVEKLDECVQCIDFGCSIFLEQDVIKGYSFESMETKPNVVSIPSSLVILISVFAKTLKDSSIFFLISVFSFFFPNITLAISA